MSGEHETASNDSEENRIYWYKFAVNERAFCIWDWDLPDRNLQFLDGIDPWYFAHMGSVHGTEVGEEDRQRAATALRLAYSQAQETFFAFVGAVIQAPECPLGWILRYETGELRDVIRSISLGGPKYSCVKGLLSWKRLSGIINNYRMDDAERLSDLQTGYADAWARLAQEFLSREAIDEYNSLKHGLRSRPGGSAIRLGLEETPGVEAPSENMGPWLGSEFGTSYHVTEWLGSPKVNFRARHASRNWHPANLAAGLHLLAVSTANVIAYLKIVGGRDPAEIAVKVPADMEIFSAPWSIGISIHSLSFDYSLELADIKPFTRDEIWKTYDNAR